MPPPKNGTVSLPCTYGHAFVEEELLGRGANVDTPKKNGVTALYVSSMNGHAGVVELLLERGANVDTQAQNEGTALMTSSQNGHVGRGEGAVGERGQCQPKRQGWRYTHDVL